VLALYVLLVRMAEAFNTAIGNFCDVVIQGHVECISHVIDMAVGAVLACAEPPPTTA